MSDRNMGKKNTPVFRMNAEASGVSARVIVSFQPFI